MTSDSVKRAQAALQARRAAEGYLKTTLWLHTDTRAELVRLAQIYGTKDLAANIAIRTFGMKPRAE